MPVRTGMLPCRHPRPEGQSDVGISWGQFLSYRFLLFCSLSICLSLFCLPWVAAGARASLWLHPVWLHQRYHRRTDRQTGVSCCRQTDRGWESESIRKVSRTTNHCWLTITNQYSDSDLVEPQSSNLVGPLEMLIWLYSFPPVVFSVHCGVFLLDLDQLDSVQVTQVTKARGVPQSQSHVLIWDNIYNIFRKGLFNPGVPADVTLELPQLFYAQIEADAPEGTVWLAAHGQEHLLQLPLCGLLLAFIHLALLPSLALSSLYPRFVFICRVLVCGMGKCRIPFLKWLGFTVMCVSASQILIWLEDVNAANNMNTLVSFS